MRRGRRMADENGKDSVTDYESLWMRLIWMILIAIMLSASQTVLGEVKPWPWTALD